MRSNVEHHPSRIVEPQRKAGSKGGENPGISLSGVLDCGSDQERSAGQEYETWVVLMQARDST